MPTLRVSCDAATAFSPPSPSALASSGRVPSSIVSVWNEEGFALDDPADDWRETRFVGLPSVQSPPFGPGVETGVPRVAPALGGLRGALPRPGEARRPGDAGGVVDVGGGERHSLSGSSL